MAKTIRYKGLKRVLKIKRIERTERTKRIEKMVRVKRIKGIIREKNQRRGRKIQTTRIESRRRIKRRVITKTINR